MAARKRTVRRAGARRSKWSASWDSPLIGSGSIKYGKRLTRGTSYFAPTSGVATAMKTAANPIMTASRSGAVHITQREILTTINSGANVSGGDFNLQVFDVNPGLSTIASWGSQIAKAFQEYKLKFRLIYTASCPSATAGQLLIAFDHNVGNPTLPTDKQQMSNFSGCVSGQVWAPMTSGTVSSGKKLYVRDGPVPAGQSAQLYDFTKILIGTADLVGAEGPVVTFGTIYIEYSMELYLPRLQFSDESILFSQFPENTPYLSYAEMVAANFQSPVASLVGYPGDTTNMVSKFPANVSGNLEVTAVVDFEGTFYLVFPVAGYYQILLSCYSTDCSENTPAGAAFMAFEDIASWGKGEGVVGVWSINNPMDDPGTPGVMLNAGGDLPDRIAFTQQEFLIYVASNGTYLNGDYTVTGTGWISTGGPDSYRGGGSQTANNVCYSSSIVVAPIGGEVLGYYNPDFLPAMPASETGMERFRKGAVKRFSNGAKRRVKRRRVVVEHKQVDQSDSGEDEPLPTGFLGGLWGAGGKKDKSSSSSTEPPRKK